MSMDVELDHQDEAARMNTTDDVRAYVVRLLGRSLNAVDRNMRKNRDNTTRYDQQFLLDAARALAYCAQVEKQAAAGGQPNEQAPVSIEALVAQMAGKAPKKTG